MISVAEAESRILTAVRTTPLEQLAITDCLGRVTGRDVISRTQPPLAVSAMDGYAVRAADVENTPVELSVVGYAPAGGSYDDTLGPGEAVRIFTGARSRAGLTRSLYRRHRTTRRRAYSGECRRFARNLYTSGRAGFCRR